MSLYEAAWLLCGHLPKFHVMAVDQPLCLSGGRLIVGTDDWFGTADGPGHWLVSTARSCAGLSPPAFARGSPGFVVM